MVIRIASLILFIVLVAHVGCSKKTPEGQSGSTGTITLQGAGSSFIAPLFRKWREQYQKEHPDTVVDYKSVGSGEGTKRFLEGTVDFGATDAAMTDEQIASAKRGAILVPVTAGIIVVAYSPEGMPPKLRLSRQVYADIFLGKITQWDDPKIAALNPNVELPAMKIAVVARQDGSGTTFAFTNHLAAASTQWKDGPGVASKVSWPANTILANGNEGVAGEIKRNVGAIGYVEYGIAKVSGLKMAVLENKSGNYIEPTGTSGLDTLIQTKMPPNLRAFMPDPEGTHSYPIVTYSWLLLNRQYDDAHKSNRLDNLVRWCLDEGQQYSESLGYIRLAPHVVELAKNALNQKGS